MAIANSPSAIRHRHGHSLLAGIALPVSDTPAGCQASTGVARFLLLHFCYQLPPQIYPYLTVLGI
jgi:hypothetical protein